MQCAFSEGPSSKGREDIGEDTKSDTPYLSLSACVTPVVRVFGRHRGAAKNGCTTCLPQIYTYILAGPRQIRRLNQGCTWW